MDTLIIAQNGVLNFGATKIELYGGGLDKAIQTEKEKEKHDNWQREKEEKEKAELEMNRTTEDIPWEEQVEADTVSHVDG